MTYIILVAGKGARLHPLTLRHPKTLYKIDDETTVVQRLVRSIRTYDKDAEIVVVVGFMYKHIVAELEKENVIIIHNPFYSVTSSIASLWFARGYLKRENVAIINGDVVMSDELTEDIICKKTERPFVLLDSSKKNSNDWNVQVQGDKVCVMSKQLSKYLGEYAYATKLDAISARLVKEEVESMLNAEMFDLFFEDCLVQMIFSKNFELYFKDIKDYRWTEVDSVDDLLLAREIQKDSILKK